MVVSISFRSISSGFVVPSSTSVLFAMDLQAYSWACGSSIRALSSTEPFNDDEGELQKQAPQAPQPPGLLSLWASAVHVAAAQGEVEDLETELGPAASLVMDVPALPSLPRSPSASNSDDVEDEKENFSENQMGTESKPLNQAESKEHLVSETNETSLVSLPETKEGKEATQMTSDPKDVGFLALLSAWSDDAPASRLLEEAGTRGSVLVGKTEKVTKLAVRGQTGRHERGAPSKSFLEELRLKFPQSRASSPPPESKRWKIQDFHIYLGQCLRIGR